MIQDENRTATAIRIFVATIKIILLEKEGMVTMKKKKEMKIRKKRCEGRRRRRHMIG